MRHGVLLIVILALMSCGGGGEEAAPQAAPPVAAVTGPGSVAAGDGVPIAYTLSGSGSPALVFIHGWMCDQTYWAEQVAAFSPSHAVVTIDLAGHGLSGTGRQDWPLMALGTDVEAVLLHLDLSGVILIGHSMGGPVALEAARLMPDRVRAVIGVDTLLDADMKWDPEELAGFLAAMEKDFSAACDQFVTSMFPEGADAALVHRVSGDMCAGPPEIGVALMRQFGDYDMAAALAAVDVPVRCINAPLWPGNVEGNRKYHDDFDAVTMDGVGHFLMMEKPGVFNARLADAIAVL